MIDCDYATVAEPDEREERTAKKQDPKKESCDFVISLRTEERDAHP